MSDATGKVILTMLLNGFTHSVLPPIGLYAFSKFSQDDLKSTNAFISLLVFIIIMSFLLNFVSFMIVQTSVCGKILNTEHLLTIAATGIIFSAIFFGLSWNVEFLGNIIRDLLPAETLGIEMTESITHSFYMFWAGMYSVASLSWFAAACPPPSTGDKTVTKV